MFNAKEFQIETETGKIPCISFGSGKKGSLYRNCLPDCGTQDFSQ